MLSQKTYQIVLLLALPFISFSQEPTDSIFIKNLNQVNVNAIKAGEKTPIAFTKPFTS